MQIMTKTEWVAYILLKDRAETFVRVAIYCGQLGNPGPFCL